MMGPRGFNHPHTCPVCGKFWTCPGIVCFGITHWQCTQCWLETGQAGKRVMEAYRESQREAE